LKFHLYKQAWRRFETRVGDGRGRGHLRGLCPQGTGEHTYQVSGAGDGLKEHLASLRGGGRGGSGAEGPGKESGRRRDGAEGVGGVHAARGPPRVGLAVPPPRGGLGDDAGCGRVECGWGVEIEGVAGSGIQKLKRKSGERRGRSDQVKTLRRCCMWSV
jgi:hypothetical protein